jgi:glucuronosyltransferase
MSELFRDRPQTPMETAIFWTEYVIRHGGAPHLRSVAVEMPWYQYLLLDVIAVLLLASVTSSLILRFVLRKLVDIFFLNGTKKKCNKKPEMLKSQ